MKLKTVDVARTSPLLNRRKAASEQTQVRSNVAWFKLAEFIRRGEKERALSLYRLLTHSLSDQAFLKKLEADIWFSFDTKQAETYYNNAAHLYKKDGRHQEALIIFQQLAAQYPDKSVYPEKVITLAGELEWEEIKQLYQQKLSTVLLQHGKIEKALVQFKAVEKQLKDAACYAFYKQLVIAALTHQYTEQKVIKQALQKSLDGLLRTSADTSLQKFLEEIKALNALWHKDALAYLKKQR